MSCVNVNSESLFEWRALQMFILVEICLQEWVRKENGLSVALVLIGQ